MAPPILSVAMLTSVGVAAASSKPNILFLMVDEMDGRILDDNSPQFKPPMPHIRNLMSQGMNFPRSYTSAPQCVPARSSLLAGRHTSDINVWDNWVGIVGVDGKEGRFDQYCVKTYGKDQCASFAKNQTVNGTFIDVLADSGYGIHLFGKVHAGAGLDRYPGQINAFPFGVQGAKAAGEWARGSGVLPRQFGPFNMNPPTNVPKPAGQDDYDAIESCVKALNGGLFQSSQPQFLYCSILIPHPKYQSNQHWMSQVPDLHNWSIPTWTPKAQLHPSDAYTQMMKGAGWEIDNADKHMIDKFRRVYFSMCVHADNMIGRVLDALKQGGSRGEPYIMFISDHGEHNLEHRQTGKNSMLEASSRVPLVIAGPGVPHGSSTQLASLHDVYPTVLGMAGVSPRPGPLAGESLLNVAQGFQRKKAHVVSQYHSVFSGTGMFMVRKDDWKLVLYAAQQPGASGALGKAWEPQLFDIAGDPWERHNVASSHPDVVETLKGLLAAEVDMDAADARKKEFDKYMFKSFWYDKKGGASQCSKSMKSVFKGFEPKLDAPMIEKWLGEPCPADAEDSEVVV